MMKIVSIKLLKVLYIVFFLKLNAVKKNAFIDSNPQLKKLCIDILKIWYISKLWESFIFDFYEFYQNITKLI